MVDLASYPIKVLKQLADNGEMHTVSENKIAIRLGGMTYTFTFDGDFCTSLEHRQQDSVFSYLFNKQSAQNFFRRYPECVMMEYGTSLVRISGIGVDIIV